MRISKSLIVALLTLGLAVSFSGFAGSPSNDDVMKVLAEADKLRKKAGSLGYEWRDTKKIMGKAEKAMKKGDTGKAMKLAKYARVQGEQAIKQAAYADKHWMDAVPK